MIKTATLTVQQWGNSLAVRIPAAIARSVKFTVGQPVELSLEDSGIKVRAIGAPRLSLAQKLDAFDSAKHAGEAMAVERTGAEVF